MSEDKFQREVLDRLISIETKQDNMIDTVADHSKTIVKHGEEIVDIRASTRSAHHRIDGIFWGAGTLGAIAGTLVNVFASLWTKTSGGGHG
ncbi:hypothetical protein Ga0466249_004845 [Sporomusaceae bacterium BoRhaA]|uniref:hypothetical protein n=1 Tax=Pelorhabdus rhamnosifermentans TaxID=2772457 RepID=UPI001C061680|nr:hypothetical protein [Pelorhabdus rhamnosifermentans]MBU2703697.1 hypothetical protein [Pelorhabdus rhamnosifermentans]